MIADQDPHFTNKDEREPATPHTPAPEHPAQLTLREIALVTAIVKAANERLASGLEPKPGSRWAVFFDAKVVVAFVGLIIPAATLLFANIRANTELELAHRRAEAELMLAKQQHEATEARLRQELDHSVNRFYFEKAVDPASTPELRIRVLSYLESDDDGRMSTWAAAELRKATHDLEEIEQLREQLREEQGKHAETLEEKEESQRNLTSLRRRLRSKESATAATTDAGVARSGRGCAEGSAFVEFGDGSKNHLCDVPSDSAYIDRYSGRLTWSIMVDSKHVTCLCDPA